MIKSGNCTFSIVRSNEINEIVKITCSGYEDEFVTVPRRTFYSNLGYR